MSSRGSRDFVAADAAATSLCGAFFPGQDALSETRKLFGDCVERARGVCLKLLESFCPLSLFFPRRLDLNLVSARCSPTLEPR